jgi:hypothetical protein
MVGALGPEDSEVLIWTWNLSVLGIYISFKKLGFTVGSTSLIQMIEGSPGMMV